MARVRVSDPSLAERLDAILEEGDDDVAIVDDLPAEPPEGAVIVLSEDVDGLEALRVGVRGVLPPTASAAEMRAAVRAVGLGLIVLAPETLPEREGALTARETQVLELMAQGGSNKTIARELEISFHTVKFHVAAILEKLGARNRADAVAQGVRLGILFI